MNLTFLIGSVLFWSIIIYTMASSAGLDNFVNILSIVIVIFGTLATIIMSYNGYDLKNMGKAMLVAIKGKKYDHVALIERIMVYAVIVKKEGVLAAQDEHADEEHDFLKTVMQDLIDSTPVENMEKKYGTYIEYLGERHGKYSGAFENLGGVAGAMGMIGTLIGLVAMLLKMDDPAAIGPAMAVALLTTFYGALIGNGFASAIATILKTLHGEEEINKKIVLQGVMLMGDNAAPKLIKETLSSMLSVKDKERIE